MPATAQHSRRYRQRLRLRVALIYGIVCQTCGSNRELELAHTQPTGLKGAGRGLTRRLLDAIKHPDKYILECKKCHRKRDWSKSDARGGEGAPF
jgi:hypothetical protein